MIVDNEIYIDEESWQNAPEDARAAMLKAMKVHVLSMEDWKGLGLQMKKAALESKSIPHANSYEPANTIIKTYEQLIRKPRADRKAQEIAIRVATSRAYGEILQMIADGKVSNPAQLAHNALYLEKVAKEVLEGQ